jgi:ABC-type glycerol-3-phosphate transport system substrate-binding protein
MNTRKTSAILAALLAIPAIALASGSGDERPPANAKPLSEIVKQVEETGHKTIVELEFEHGVYKIEAFDAQGRKVKLRADPVTGKLSVK